MLWWHSFRARLILLMSLVVLIPALLSGAYSQYRSRQTLTELAAESYMQHVISSAGRVEDEIIAQKADLIFIVQSPTMRRYINNTDDPAALDSAIAFIETFLLRHIEDYAGACLIDATGQEIACIHTAENDIVRVNALDLLDRADEDYFTEPMTLVSIPGTGLPVYIANVADHQHAGIVGGEQIVRLSTLMQADDGEIIGVLVLGVRFSSLVDLMDCDGICSGFSLIDTDGSALYSDPADGSLLFERSPETRRTVLGQAAGMISDPADAATLHTFARIRPTGQSNIQWTLLYQQSFSAISQDITTTNQVILLFTLTALGVALLVAVVLINRIAAPITALTTAADQVAQGKLDATVNTPKTNDEIGRLVAAFNAMLSRLWHSIDDLQTAKHEAEINQRRFRAVFDGANDAILLVDDDLRYVDVNPAASLVFGIKRDDFLNMTVPDLYPDQPAEIVQARFRKFLRDGYQTAEFRYKRDDHYTVICEYEAVANILPGLHLSVMRDVTERKLNEAARLESEQRYRGIVEDTPVLVCSFKPGGEITFVNQAYCDYFEVTADKLVGQNFLLNLPEHEREGVLAILDTLTVDEPARTHEHQVMRADGSLGWQRWTNRAVFDDRGEVMSYQAVGEDITNWYETQELLKLRNKALEASANALVLTDARGNIEWVNPAFTRLTGYTLDEVKGQNPRILHSGEQDDAFYRDLWQTVLSGQVWFGTLVNKRKDGTFYTEEQTITPVTDENGVVTHFIGVKQDVTQRERSEALRREQERLKARLEKEQEQNALIHRIISTLSHDMRIPLSVITLSRDILAKHYKDLPLDKRQERLDAISQQVRFILNMLEDTVALARGNIDASNLNLTEVNLAALCQVSIDVSKQRATPRHRLGFNNIGQLETIVADETLLSRILLNLLSNAVKYSPDGGEICLSLDRDRNWAVIEISDEGIGIPAEKLNRIFDPFFRLDDVRHIQGTGLGLSIVRDCVERHQGHIAVESTPGVGTTFTITLPLDLPIPLPEATD